MLKPGASPLELGRRSFTKPQRGGMLKPGASPLEPGRRSFTKPQRGGMLKPGASPLEPGRPSFTKPQRGGMLKPGASPLEPGRPSFTKPQRGGMLKPGASPLEPGRPSFTKPQRGGLTEVPALNSPRWGCTVKGVGPIPRASPWAASFRPLGAQNRPQKSLALPTLEKTSLDRIQDPQYPCRPLHIPPVAISKSLTEAATCCVVSCSLCL